MDILQFVYLRHLFCVKNKCYEKEDFYSVSIGINHIDFYNVRVCATPVPVHFDVGIIDPTSDQDEPQRSPATVPSVEIEDNTLIFITSCDGMELRLVNEEDETVFMTIISGSTLVLPSTLYGDYQLQIISENYIFYGDITL